MAHVRQKLGLGPIRSLRCFLCVTQEPFGAYLFGDVAGGASITQEPPRGVKERIAAYGAGVFGLLMDVPRIDKIAKRLMTVQRCKMLLPLSCLGFGICSEFHPAVTDTGRWFVAKRTNPIRQIGNR